MKKIMLTALALTATIAATQPAKAQVSLFDDSTTQQIDSSLDLRRSTVEQDNPVRDQSVLDRSRPDYDPRPIKVGSFNLVPMISFGALYNSNIFTVPSHAASDEVWDVSPAVTMVSNWSRHAVAITGLGDFNYYTQDSKQNYNTGALQAEGRYDIAPMTWLSGSAGYQRVSEARGTLSTPGGQVGPSEYSLYSGHVGAYRGVGLLKAKLDFDTSYYNYSPVDLVGGGSLNQTVRNRTQNNVGGEAEYTVSENFKPYVRSVYNWRNYTEGGVNSSDGYQLDVGSRMDFGGVTTADVYAGYLSQNYYNYANGANDAFDFGASVLWNVTGLTSVEGRVSRSIEETEATLSPSALASQGSVRVSHELRRNIVLSSQVGYTNYDFQNSTRSDDLYNAGLAGRYLINRYMHSDLTYAFQHRDSNVPGNNYNDHIVALQLGVQY